MQGAPSRLPKNLILALRKVGANADELHDIIHWIGAGARIGATRTRWVTYVEPYLEFVKEFLKLS